MLNLINVYIVYLLVVLIIVLSITLITKNKTVYPTMYRTIYPSLLPMSHKPIIAIVSNYERALGRVHTDLITHMRKDFEFIFYNWSNPDHLRMFCDDFVYFNKILGNTSISEQIKYISFFNKSLNLNYITEKMYSVCHCPCINTGKFYNEQIRTRKGNFSGVSAEIQSMMKPYVDKSVFYTPCGVNIEDFPYNRKIEKLKRIGYIGNPKESEESNEIKRPDMFKKIAQETNLHPIYIHGKDWRENDKIYKDIDILVCCSEFEGNPLPIFEAAACGICVLSRPVGNTVKLKNIKHFNNAEEAIKIINELRNETLKNYIQSVTEEVRFNWNWSLIAEKYWKPFLNSGV